MLRKNPPPAQQSPESMVLKGNFESRMKFWLLQMLQAVNVLPQKLRHPSTMGRPM